MDWQQKLAAIQAFAGSHNVALRMRRPGDWYVDAGMSLGGDGILYGTYGNGTTPEDAVRDHWQKFTVEIPADKYVVADRGDPHRRGRWNGFMWELMTDEEAERFRENHRERTA
jgi:hypothetical protein